LKRRDAEPLAVLGYQTPAPAARADRVAVLMLLVATVFWGCGFTWAKAAGEAVHRAAGLPDGSLLGPVFILAARFVVAGLVLLAAVPAARRGWSWRGAMRIGWVGVLLGAGIVFQHLALDRTSEAVTAFITSLTVLFVPLVTTLFLRRPPPAVMWFGVCLAMVGVWLLTGASAAGFGSGEFLALACAFTFSLYILAVNSVAADEDPWRLTAGQFLVAGLICAAFCLPAEAGPAHLRPAAVGRLLAVPAVWTNLVLLTVFPTLAAYILLNLFQPRLDPTRAALIYLMEPVVATVYASAMTGRAPDGVGIAGGGLIIAANVVVELLAARRAGRERR
jgi:drug/metabolite transporter (DMT)-like permease